MSAPARIERRIRVAALLVLAGLVLEAVTLCILHPLSFVTFASVGILLTGSGIVLFLLTLLQAGKDEMPEETLP